MYEWVHFLRMAPCKSRLELSMGIRGRYRININCTLSDKNHGQGGLADKSQSKTKIWPSFILTSFIQSKKYTHSINRAWVLLNDERFKQ